MNPITKITRNLSAALTLCLLLAACAAKTNFLPAPAIHSENTVRLAGDSVYRADTLLLQQRGDTVYIVKTRVEYRQRNIIDSIRLADTIPLPFPVETVREVHSLHWYHRALCWTGLAALAAAALWLFLKIRK
jgi:hypothetical protein